MEKVINPGQVNLGTIAQTARLNQAIQVHGDAWIDLIQAQLKLKLAEKKLEKIQKERRVVK